MAINEPANPKVASLASQGLYDPASLTPDDVRAICATAWRECLTTAKPRLWDHARSTSKSTWPWRWCGWRISRLKQLNEPRPAARAAKEKRRCEKHRRSSSFSQE
jgi:hypothetical protein